MIATVFRVRQHGAAITALCSISTIQRSTSTAYFVFPDPPRTIIHYFFFPTHLVKNVTFFRNNAKAWISYPKGNCKQN
ncbi:hypothetical protein CDAR_184001 [Caerostris darwini]|uniref:Secreted protein n=1 Tax=Caerostris darwini TaxID=1538125 RepID=A0AAV4TVX1_9ARAC|nr:hypothetical protein CDAR_184001 [Caerostris darwini]